MTEPAATDVTEPVATEVTQPAVGEAPARPRRLLDGPALAFGFLTALPVGRSWPEGGAREMVGYFPWVGVALGAGAGAAAMGFRAVGVQATSSLVAATLIVAGWSLATRMLHWDGLADTADGLGCPDDARRLEVMRDSRIGAFGALAIVFVAMIEVFSVASLIDIGEVSALIVAPMVARVSACYGIWSVGMAKRTGLGAAVSGRPTPTTLLACAIAVVLSAAAMMLSDGLPGLAFMTVGLAAAVLLPRALSRPVGGLTGDILGASILLTEAVTLAAAAILL